MSGDGLRADSEAAYNALASFASAIMCGEPWSDALADQLTAAKVGLRNLTTVAERSAATSAACVDPSDTALLDAIEGKMLQVGRTDDEPPRVLVWWTREGMSGLVYGVGDSLREAVRIALAAT